MQTKHFEREHVTLTYSDYQGEGELVLMFPGMGSLRSEYRFLAAALNEKGYRAITIDLRGQGESSVPGTGYDVPTVGEDILALIRHLDAGPVHIIGTSFAPAPIVWAAAEYPELFRSLILISPFVRDAKMNPFMLALFWLMMNNPWRVRLWTIYYRSLFPTIKPTDLAEYLTLLRENLSEKGRFTAVKQLGMSSRKPSQERLERIQSPTLVVMGTKDPDFPNPAEEGKSIAEQTGGTLETIEGAGHYPHAEMPEKTIPIVLEFLQQNAAGHSS